ncbi:daunorubicin resistance protein DrrA family ABC transporter ATP-binding protein [Actinotalea fermentans]|uniref:Daunorubicin resistance protein DrrA family ABC transporter ATP-binding protein n=1 Tax=Actinotalea fermentans TaxID=43671 RepID=A0A511Z265_9CELL|nr:daunorubicin resistance protein DrrA family ABC transporter ATP-binding protein [Actinotalea fermentans]KGM16769.1 ABC transporter [Actinotalea fermentans ATCC 43279 = JCM 9966 = DSM 3133]GEN81538.1 daunorubicin resistance protein DrrA family ABC transporter ATP-binding protein [Actinotalea fermentans]
MAPPHTTGPTTALLADALVKTYRSGRRTPPVRALDGLSFEAEPGTVFGLLGPNGAGKSTTVKVLSTLTRPDAGRAVVAGVDVLRHPEKVRRAIGLVAQRPVSDPMHTGRENLVLAARLQGMSGRDARARADELLDRFGLVDAGARLAKTYSGGMARKLDVAMGLVHRPRVLFLDEPTTGLDPEARAQMWAELEAVTRAELTTVLLTTHYLEEADRLARRLAIVDRGRVVAHGTPDELKDDLRGDAVVVQVGRETGDPSAVAAALRTLERVPDLRDVTSSGRTVRARADRGGAALPHVLAALDQAGIQVAAASVARPSLDDVYLRHTGRTLDEEVAA